MSNPSKYARFLSKVSQRRQPSAIRALSALTRLPGMISLAGGLPASETFPFHAVNLQLKDGTSLHLSQEEIDTAFQYGPTAGLPQFVQWLKGLMQQEHLIQQQGGNDWDVVVTGGSQDALSRAFEMLLDEGDCVLLENPTYSGALASLNPLQVNKVSVECDQEGIVPERLEALLEKLHSEGVKPKLLYTIPTGQNPSGATLTVERKRAIYNLAKRYDFIILEDDPYYYLQLDREPWDNASFLSMDTEGLVLRFDSLSKVLSSGLRIGWCTGPSELINRINLHMQATELHTSNLSQMVAYKTMEAWQMEGFRNHVHSIRSFYRQRRDVFVSLVDKHLGDRIRYTFPQAGMFLWMELVGVTDSKVLIEQKAREKNILLVPGQAFSPLDEKGPFVRASFSTESDENMEKAVKALADLLDEELGHK